VCVLCTCVLVCTAREKVQYRRIRWRVGSGMQYQEILLVSIEPRKLLKLTYTEIGNDSSSYVISIPNMILQLDASIMRKFTLRMMKFQC